MRAYRYFNLAYLPITKNASSTYGKIFESLGWQETQFDLLSDDVEVFSHIRDPIERHFKGTAEFILQNHLIHLLDDPLWKFVWAKAVMDIHSYPITWGMGGRENRIHWIPIHHSLDTDDLTRAYLSSHGIDIESITKINVTEDGSLRKLIYDRLMKMHQEMDSVNTLSYFYDADIVLWNKVLASYNDMRNRS